MWKSSAKRIFEEPCMALVQMISGIKVEVLNDGRRGLE
jgi:hypothetical protein